MGETIRTYIYVDGFNLYYGALKGTPYRWLNLKQLALNILPAGHIVEKVKYFTARVSGAADPQAPARQQSYLNALATVPEIEIHFGNFLSKTIWRPMINLPVANVPIHSPQIVQLPPGNHQVNGRRVQSLPVGSYPVRTAGQARAAHQSRPLPDALVAEVHTMEEKGSDVNLAAHLLNDAWSNRFDVAAVISNDTDLVTPIRMVAQERMKPVFVICPGRSSISPPLARVATYTRHIRPSMLRNAQFPDPIAATGITKPNTW